MRNALLLGNGINRAVDNNGWRDLLRDLAREYDCELPGDAAASNLPLEFERIYFAAAKKHPGIPEEKIIDRIQEYIPRIEDFSLWQNYTSLPVKHVMTTNYDYNIEAAIMSGFSEDKVRERTKERKYSLFRRIVVNDKRVWHVHGEAGRTRSICLGYDHYCRYLAEIQNFVKDWESLQPKDAESWVTVFLTRNVHIAGLSLSFIELDLWWLLNYWARKSLDRDPEKDNQIHYYYPKPSGSGKGPFDEQLYLMESLGVRLHPVPFGKNDWKKFYRDVAKAIESFL